MKKYRRVVPIDGTTIVIGGYQDMPTEEIEIIVENFFYDEFDPEEVKQKLGVKTRWLSADEYSILVDGKKYLVGIKYHTEEGPVMTGVEIQ